MKKQDLAREKDGLEKGKNQENSSYKKNQRENLLKRKKKIGSSIEHYYYHEYLGNCVFLGQILTKTLVYILKEILKL